MKLNNRKKHWDTLTKLAHEVEELRHIAQNDVELTEHDMDSWLTCAMGLNTVLGATISNMRRDVQ